MTDRDVLRVLDAVDRKQASDEEDAARYRWLRRIYPVSIASLIGPIAGRSLDDDDIDDIIDMARMWGTDKHVPK
jgi:hypothetical protein